MDKEKINYINHIEWLIVFITLIGGIYSFSAGFYSLDARVDAINARFDQLNSRFDQFMISAHEESKDFHARLCVQDIDYKSKLAEYDREYKFHLYHFHGQ